MNKKYFSFIPSVAILALTSQVVLAQSMPDARTGTGRGLQEDKLSEKMDKWTEQAQKWADKWKDNLETGANDVVNQGRERICKAAQDKVGVRWQKYYDARMNRVDNMEQGILAVEKRVEFFKSKGLTTTELETDITTLTNLIAEYKKAYTAFLNALEEPKTMSCANYQGQFLGKLKIAKNEWGVVQTEAQTIKDFYQSDIKPDLQALRAQVAEQNLESEED